MDKWNELKDKEINLIKSSFEDQLKSKDHEIKILNQKVQAL